MFIMSDEWDDYADDWDENEGVIIYARHTFETLMAEIDISGLDIFDFGCGTGNLAVKMARDANHIVAIDSSAKMVSILKNKNIKNITAKHLELSKGDISDKFDLITASSVFAFVGNFPETLKLLKGMLKPGGALVQWDWLAVEGKDDFGFSPKYLKSIYNEVGFDEVNITQPFSLKKGDGEMKVVMVLGKTR
jgi:predicted TPR repeat methyltransferase